MAEISAVSAAGRLLRARSSLVAVAGLIGLAGSEFRLPLVINEHGAVEDYLDHVRFSARLLEHPAAEGGPAAG